MINRLSLLFLAGLALLPLAAAQARDEVCAVDALEREVCLDGPASRIAALSPGATELTFAAGAGERIVAVVDHSDYPPRPARFPGSAATAGSTWSACWRSSPTW